MNIIYRIRRKVHKAFYPAMGEVWMLHRVVPTRSTDPRQKEIEITPEYLEGLILRYRDKGYRFISIDEVAHILAQHKQRPKSEKFVCITLDDGYADNHEYAYPIFKKYNTPFAIYVTTGFVEGTAPMWWYDTPPKMLKWEQIRTLDNDPLCTIGIHTVTHPRLTEIDNEEVLSEIKESKNILEQHLEHMLCHFSYPHGSYDAAVRKAVEDENIRSAVLVWGGKVRRDQNIFEIPRIPITQP